MSQKLLAWLADRIGPEATVLGVSIGLVIYYNRTDWQLLLFVLVANLMFWSFRFIWRRHFGA